ncbi:MAG TPA: secretin N-terminal domain-containing protein [Candidatus Acidoferrum sp.]|nr:secretin N-terminal domain-containing protein [Candidatus Acidoferrum sp.]
MKTRIVIATLLGCLIWQPGAMSQTDTNAANPAAPISTATAGQPATGTDTAPSSAGTADIAAATNAAPPAAPAPASESAATVANPSATPVASPAEATAEAGTNATEAAAAAVPATIPLIQFQDVPITTAIENLARQAGINYLIDPKIGFGQPDQNGQVKPEPTLSIRWENVTAEQALMALLDNYNLQLVADRRTQISRITTKDPTAPPPLSTRVIQLKYAGTSNMVSSIQAALTDKRSKVLPDARTSQLVLVATENEQEAVDKLIEELDKPTRQVLIETKLVQISSTPSTKKGVDWSGTLAAQNVTFGNGIIDPTSSKTITAIPGTPSSTGTTPGGGYSTGGTPNNTSQTLLSIIQGLGGVSYNTASGFTPGIGFLNADGAHAVLSFLNASYDAQVVSTPRVVTLDNEMASIEVTRSYPVINVVGGTQNSSGSSSITYSNIGTILQVTPRISANDYIWLKVVPVVSSHFGDVQITVQGGAGNPSTSYPVPEFDYRKIDSQVMIPNGNTLVMGGLVQDNPTASYTKVPILGDIPGLGWAFRSESKNMNKDNLVIFMTPTIIKNSDFQQISPSGFLQSKPNTMKSPMNPNSIWDSAQPVGDWSNPAPVAGEFTKK